MLDFPNIFRRSLNTWPAQRQANYGSASSSRLVPSKSAFTRIHIEIFILLRKSGEHSFPISPNFHLVTWCTIATRLGKDPEEARFFKRGNSAPLTATEQHLGLKSSHGILKSFSINDHPCGTPTLIRRIFSENQI